MRTIDPFLAPGLWGGAPMPPQSPTMTAGRFTRPPEAPAVIAHCFITPAPLASLAGSVLGPDFHAWFGRSGRRRICSIYPVHADGAGYGLPDFTSAVVIGADRQQGRLRSLAVFTLNEGDNRRAHIDAAVAAGASEWHVHLLAQDEHQRRAILDDFEVIQGSAALAR